MTKAQTNRMEVDEIRMLRLTCCKIMLDIIPTGVFRVELKVATTIDKLREGRLCVKPVYIRLRNWLHVRNKSLLLPLFSKVLFFQKAKEGKGIKNKVCSKKKNRREGKKVRGD